MWIVLRSDLLIISKKAIVPIFVFGEDGQMLKARRYTLIAKKDNRTMDRESLQSQQLHYVVSHDRELYRKRRIAAIRKSTKIFSYLDRRGIKYMGQFANQGEFVAS